MLSKTWPALLFLPLLACSDAPPAGTPPEVLGNAAASVDERHIRATTDGAVAELAFEVERRGGEALVGAIRAELLDVTGSEDVVLSSAAQGFTQTEARARHTLRLAGLPPDMPRADAAGLVVRWSLETPAGELFGRRSLYAALGQLEVQIRGATALSEHTELWIVARDGAGAPVAGAEARAELLEDAGPRELARGVTDARGELLLAVALPAGLETGAARITVSKGGAESWANTRLTRVHDERLRLALDKTIYKPGQTLHLRLVGLAQASRAPLADRDVVVEALDGKGNKVFRETVTTDDFGVAALDIPTDTRVNEGDWKLRAAAGEARAELTVPVQQYTLPKLKVSVTHEQAFLQPGETLQGSVSAHYLFGMPVTQGQVRVEARLDDRAIASTEATTDAEGRATYALTVPESLRSGLDAEGATLTVLAEVTDTAGQVEAAQANLPLVEAPLKLRVLPEAAPLALGLDNRVFVLVSDPLGRPMRATVDVTGAISRSGIQTDARGVASFEFGPSEPAELSVRATDGAERTVEAQLTLQAAPAILLRPDHAFYGPGDTARVEVRAPADVSRVLCEVRRGAEGRLSRAVDLVDGRGSMSFELGPDLQGGLLIEAFALQAAGEVITGQRRLFARADDQLQVELTASADTFAPGAEATVTVRALDAEGRPKVAAVGLTAVDEAVFALGGEPGDDLSTYFRLDSRLLPATTSALGQGPRDLLIERPRAEADQLAALLFAASGPAAPAGLSYNSVAEERPRVAQIVSGRVAADVDAAFARIAESSPELDELPKLVERALAGLVDPFGRRYRVDVAPDADRVEVTCHGPDEQAGTADDVSVTRSFRWLRWGYSTDDGDFGAGGGMDANNAAPPAAPDPTTEAEEPDGPGEARVRSDFRETVYANPWLVTDATGIATVRFPLADSITTWRLSADAHTKDGRLGSARLGVRTFQDFFVDLTLPPRLTVGDEIEVPAVVYNYLDTPQSVRVQVVDADWLTVLGAAEQTLTLAPSEVRAARFTIRVDAAGTQALTLRGAAGAISDALVRTVSVVPDGTLEIDSHSDKLAGEAVKTLTIPADALAGGTHVSLSLTPGFAAEAVQGLEGMIQEPNGCFEQTTASAWPNTMVAVYLETTGQMTDEKRAEILPVVQRGYQRLLTFESPTGGFNWWGDDEPGNRILSAIMLWHLEDLEQLIEIDADVRDRTLAWLVDQQNGDGHWASGDALHAGNEVLGTSDIRTTAFIAWALAHTGWADDAVRRGSGWLKANLPDASDLYANALSMNALAKAEPTSQAASTLFSRLDALKEAGDEGKVRWPTETPSWTGSGGEAAAIETTGLVAYGLYQARAYPENAAGAVRFLVANKDAVGSWYNTQATMNALRALLAAASPQGSDAQGALTVRIGDTALEPISVTPENGDVYRTFDLTPHVGAGDTPVTLTFEGTGEVTYKLTREVYRPRQAPVTNPELDLTVAYDGAQATVGAPVTAHVQAAFTGQGVRDQVLVRVGRAPGFAPDTAQLDAHVAAGRAARYEVDAEYVTFYLMGLEAGAPRDLSFDFVPGLAASAVAPPSEMYVYYQRDIRAQAPAQRFEVTAP